MSIDFSYDESEVLRELMNIAFGQAAADLSDLLDQLIGISIPGLSVMEPLEFRNHLIQMVEPIESLTISEQSFSGQMKGTGFLIFTDETPNRLCMLMNGEEPTADDDAILDSTLVEVTNLVVGACLGKMMDLLKEKISFSHPGIMVKHNPMIPLEFFKKNDTQMIVLNAHFTIQNEAIKGYLFLACSEESIDWLKSSMNQFMADYI